VRAAIFVVDGVPVDTHGKAWRGPLPELMESDWSDTAIARRGGRKRSSGVDEEYLPTSCRV
jgi:hypothetical protein